MNLKFFSEVRKEFNKIVWPSWTETRFTAIMVLVFAFILTIYLLAMDQIIVRLIRIILG